MADRWVDKPAQAPSCCHRTLSDRPEDGPYFEEDWFYLEPVRGPEGELRLRRPILCRLYTSARWLRAMCDSPGSPFVLTTREEAEEREAELADLRRQNQDYAMRVEELESELAEKRAEPPVDVDSLAERLVGSMETRFQKKAGRPPKSRDAT